MGRSTVLTLDDATYALHGEFGPGARVTFVLLPGFGVVLGTVPAAVE